MIRKTSPRDIRCKHVIQNRLPRCRHQTLFVLVVPTWRTVVYRLSYFKITFYVHSKHLTNLLSSTYDDHIFMYFQNGAGHTPAVSRRCRPHPGRLSAVPATPRPPSGGAGHARPPSGGAGHTPAGLWRCRSRPGPGGTGHTPAVSRRCHCCMAGLRSCIVLVCDAARGGFTIRRSISSGRQIQ